MARTGATVVVMGGRSMGGRIASQVVAAGARAELDRILERAP